MLTQGVRSCTQRGCGRTRGQEQAARGSGCAVAHGSPRQEPFCACRLPAPAVPRSPCSGHSGRDSPSALGRSGRPEPAAAAAQPLCRLCSAPLPRARWWRGHGHPAAGSGEWSRGSVRDPSESPTAARGQRGSGTARAVRPGHHPRDVPSYPPAPHRAAELQGLSSAPRGPCSPCLRWLCVPGCGQHFSEPSGG